MSERREVTDLELAIARLQEHMAATEKALALQAAEYERRLDQLNGEASRIAMDARTYVRQDVLGPRLDAIEKKADEAAGIARTAITRREHDALAAKIDENALSILALTSAQSGADKLRTLGLSIAVVALGVIAAVVALLHL